MHGLLAIVDIGKSNARLIVVDPASGQTVHIARRASRSVAGPVRQLDIAGVQAWLLDALAACPERSRIGCIVPVAHGAACVMLDGADAVVLAPDYEDPAFEQDRDAYGRARDGFAHTLSPDLPLGLNLGRQIFHVQRRLPAHYARIRRILPYPQYWAWMLSGIAASEITSLGCHTDLWSPATARFSALATARGWTDLFAPLRPAADDLGAVRASLAARTGLDPRCRVLCGIHDSNAAYLRHRMHRPAGAAFSVISSGTWTVILASDTDLAVLQQERDMLANIDAFGAVVGTARFMGGREYEAVAGCDAPRADLQGLARALQAGAMVLPSFTAGGQFREQRGEIRGGDALDAVARAALASLHVALLSDTALDLLGATGDIVIDGPLGENPIYATLLALLRPARAGAARRTRSRNRGRRALPRMRSPRAATAAARHRPASRDPGPRRSCALLARDGGRAARHRILSLQQRRRARDDPRLVVQRAGAHPPGLAHARAQGRIAHQCRQRVRERTRGTRRHQQPGLSGAHLLARAADVARHHRQPRQHRLDHRHRQPFEMTGQHEDVRRRQQGCDIVAVAEASQPRPQQRRIGRPDEGGVEILAVVRGEARAHHPEFRVRHRAHRLEQFGIALVDAPGGRRR